MSNSIVEIKVNERELPSHTLNILPCRVHFTGPVTNVPRHFTPTPYNDYRATEVKQQFMKISEDEQKEIEAGKNDHVKVVHFRGRKLKGVDLKVDDEYMGCLIQEGTSRIVTDATTADDEDDEDNTVLLKSWTAVSAFDKVTLWNHEAIPATDNVFMTGLTDFVKLSKLIHDDF